jgi:hypothetical protein
MLIGAATHNAIHKTDPVMTPTEFKEWLTTQRTASLTLKDRQRWIPP